MSRFLIQMKYESVIKPDYQDLNFEIKSHGSIGEIIERTEEHQYLLSSQFLDKNIGRILSPSAINTWLNCRMKFFYRYVNHLKEPDKITADIDPAMFGNILHEMMKSLYRKFNGELVSKDLLDSIISDEQLLEIVTNETIIEIFTKGKNSITGGNELIVRDVLKTYMNRILHTDKSFAPFTILNLEDSYSFPVSTLANGSQIEVAAGGKVDRVDVVGDVTRIVDYKTGAVADSIKSIGDLFTDDRVKDTDCWLQTLLYCEAYLATNHVLRVRPSVYKIKKMGGDSFTDKLKLKIDRKSVVTVDDYSIVRDEFVSGLKDIISTIFNRDEPFSMTGDIRGKCSYCPYRLLCMR